MSAAPRGGLGPDLDRILHRCGSVWNNLGGAHILVTGGTGYFGRWLAAAIDHADRRLGLGCRMTLVARRPDALWDACPFLIGSPTLTTIAADVRSMPTPARHPTHVIHAATPVTGQSGTGDAEMIDICEAGTRRVMEIAGDAGVAGILVAGTGAAYGPQPEGMGRIPESFMGSAEPASAYAEGKRRSESIAEEAARDGLPVCIARCFAQAGPHLPLDCQFALGNFVADALRGDPIVVRGDGTAVRTYLYATDLVEWILTLLVRGCRAGEPTCVNLGSEEPITIADLARLVARTDQALSGRSAPLDVVVERRAVPGVGGNHYVPDCSRAEARFGLRASVPIADAVARVLQWNRTGAVPDFPPRAEVPA